MPLYEYLCIACGHKFDTLRSISAADSPIACSHCASDRTKRQLSTFFAHIQGAAQPISQLGCGGCRGGSCSTCRH